ncbi:MAG: quinoprotein amine dehydrogenase, beta chain-like protein, partial [Thiomonas sp. 14-64-326]
MTRLYPPYPSLLVFGALSLSQSVLAAQAPSALLPSGGRLLTPAGQIVETPNFPTQIALSDGHVAVLTGGASKQQNVLRFAAETLQPEGRVGALFAKDKKHAAPGATVAQGDQNGGKADDGEQIIKGQSLFQGLAAGPDGTIYATGGNSDDLLALGSSGNGPLRLLRRYRLQWQPFPRDQYPYRYAGDWQQTRHFYPDSVVIGPHGRHAYVTGMLANSLARIDLQTGVTHYLNVGSYPFAVTLADGGKRLVV